MEKYSGKTYQIHAPMQAVVHSINVAVGDIVQSGQEVAVLEAMKMQHGLLAPASGTIAEILFVVGEVVEEGGAVLVLHGGHKTGAQTITRNETDPDNIRPDLAELQARLARTLDANRPEKVARRHEKGHRTARENVEDICDTDSFTEYGQLVVAA
ncbi:MAG: hypothetical protein EBT71_05535 [Alphaproteobacteria bacterium]|nr:hypothetical protein [Alphaproteobacteria bacterium]